MNRMRNLTLLVILYLSSQWVALGQAIEAPFDSEQWNMDGAKYALQEFEGKEALLLQEGFIYLNDVSFLNGTIEFDINFSSLRNFPGVLFRIYQPGNFEEFYIRPHQSGNPDANQYTPVFNGLTGWQLYHGSQYATPVDYTFNQWHHLKIEVKGNKAKVFYDDMERPLLNIDELKQKTIAGTLGLRTFTNVHFANFKYTLDNSTYEEEVVEVADIAGLIKTWQLSDIQVDSLFEGKQVLQQSDLKNINWKACPVQSSGVLNIAEYLQMKQGSTTALVKLKIKSDRKQTKQVEFGFSDFVQVYLNGDILYAGINNFRSRDYRYLGTIGYFDSIFLPLQKGDNEVIFVVRENFGGWGLQAVIKDQTSIEID